jgi:hypothetical protein
LRDVRAWSRQVSRPGVIVRLFGVRLASADGSYGLTPRTAKRVRRPGDALVGIRGMAGGTGRIDAVVVTATDPRTRDVAGTFQIVHDGLRGAFSDADSGGDVGQAVVKVTRDR